MSSHFWCQILHDRIVDLISGMHCTEPSLHLFAECRNTNLSPDFGSPKSICWLLLYSWFAGRRGPKSAEQQSENGLRCSKMRGQVHKLNRAQQSAGASSAQLLKVSVPISKNCTEVYARAKVTINSAKQMCAGAKDRDSCSGDSGGPLVQK